MNDKITEHDAVNRKIYGLLRKDLHRIRHEIAVTTRALRTQQGLFYADFKQKGGGFLSPQKVERLELERIEAPPLEVLIVLASAFGRRLRFSFVESDEIEKPMIPGSGWEAAARTDSYSDKKGVVGYWAEALFERRKARAEAALAAKTVAAAETLAPPSIQPPEEPVAEPTDSKID